VDHLDDSTIASTFPASRCDIRPQHLYGHRDPGNYRGYQVNILSIRAGGMGIGLASNPRYTQPGSMEQLCPMVFITGIYVTGYP